jgi:hypothetical protein
VKWPWTRYREERDAFDGAEAREEATAHLAQAQARWPEVTRVAQSLRELRERNHFGEQVKLIFRGDQ